MSAELLHLMPVKLAEAKASCGCCFLLVRERLFDPREGEWSERESHVLVPCRDEHKEIGLRLRGKTVEELAQKMDRAT